MNLTQIVQSWDDYHFKWDPKDFGNVSVLNLPYTAVWRPDILLYNCADEKFDRTFPTNTIMNYTGQVQWMPPGLFKSTCNIDILWFPFDRQNCTLKFGSWTYNGDQIDFRLKCINTSQPDCTEVGPVDQSEYLQNGEFHLIDASVHRTAQLYECCPYYFIDIKMYIILQRRALYYVFNLIVPCLLISGMSLMVFMLPPDAGEKISLGVTILLSLTMFLQLVADKLPQTSESIPLIGIYFQCTMAICSLSIVFTVLVLNYHHRSADVVTVPSWIKTVINTYLARLMFMEPPTRSTVIVDDDDMDSLNSDGHLLKQNVFHDSNGMDILAENNEDSFDEYEQRSNSKNGIHGWNLRTDTLKKPPIPSTGAYQFSRTNGPVVCDKFNSPGTGAMGMMRERSSKSLLANVLNLEDDFRASGIPASPPMESNPVRVFKDHPRPKTISGFESSPRAPPPPYPVKYFENHNKGNNEFGSDVFSPDNLSDVSENVIASPDRDSNRIVLDDNVPILPVLLSSYRTDLENIVTELRFITSKIREDEQEALVNLEWKFAARVIDRFCLVVFGIFNVLTTVVILGSAPNLIASFQTQQ
ncbi:Neuronal acetylcholine receptor subunit alpha-7 [Paragonimus heterotremus]|uniref:Neuronal acetylcholine receptor subunit alpha-7 n=1 Tax=Paragonimus heterotremus TaxID=100268 RepID=A0A8J4X3U5_9TREM|nr:Neuronal acetylcholine receptor subunit alpha-7 [Paragonimus heterotremus]